MYKEVFTSDDIRFGGNGVKNERVTAKPKGVNGQKYHIAIDIPPFSTLYFYKRAGRKKDQPKEEHNETKKRNDSNVTRRRSG